MQKFKKIWHIIRQYWRYILITVMCIFLAYLPYSFLPSYFNWLFDQISNRPNSQDFLKRIWFWIWIYIATKIAFDDVEKNQNEQQKQNIYNAYKHSIGNFKKDLKASEEWIIEWLWWFLWKTKEEINQYLNNLIIDDNEDEINEEIDKELYDLIYKKIEQIEKVTKDFEKTWEISEINQDIMKNICSLKGSNFLYFTLWINKMISDSINIYRKMINFDPQIPEKKSPIKWLMLKEMISYFESAERWFKNLKTQMEQRKIIDLFLRLKSNIIKDSAIEENKSNILQWYFIINWAFYQHISQYSELFTDIIISYLLFIKNFDKFNKALFESIPEYNKDN